MNEYSQGICEDGAAILKNGQMMTIEEILADLRERDQLQSENAILQRVAQIFHDAPEVDYTFTDSELAEHDAEVIENACRAAMPGPGFPPDDPPKGLQEYCEGIAEVMEYAKQLRQKAQEPES